MELSPFQSGPSVGSGMYICGKWCLLYFCVDCPQAWPGLEPFFLSLQESDALVPNYFLLSREHTIALRALANDYVDQLLGLVHDYVVENGLSQLDAPEIHAEFYQIVSQAHTKIPEQYIHLLYTIRLIHEYIFSVPDPVHPCLGIRRY
jgi:hypothetical protein